MAKEFVRDFYGRVIGTIETQGTKKIVRDFYGRVLGTYNSTDNRTRDFYGRVLSTGDTTASLLYKDK